MASRSATYELFLAHPLANQPSARALYDLLQQDLCRRIAAELDRRAPWTR